MMEKRYYRISEKDDHLNTDELSPRREHCLFHLTSYHHEKWHFCLHSCPNQKVVSNPTSPSSTSLKHSPPSANPSFKDSFNLLTSLPPSCNHSGLSHYHFSLGLPPKSFLQIQYISHRAITVMFSESIPDDAPFRLASFKGFQLP